VSVWESGSTVVVTSNGAHGGTAFFDRAAVNGMYFLGGEGNDRFDNATSVPSSAYGGGGDDVLWGGFTNDALYGGAGNDQLLGFGGNDLLLGDDGDDLVSGGSGKDTLYGDSYDIDTGHSGTGRDSLDGGAGADYLHGGAGDDHLDGGFDGLRDTVTGGTGADTFVTHWTWAPVYLPGYPPLWYPQYESENVLDFDAAAGDVMEYVQH
jgi:Ca2+-binding RTX toxin-like protein